MEGLKSKNSVVLDSRTFAPKTRMGLLLHKFRVRGSSTLMMWLVLAVVGLCAPVSRAETFLNNTCYDCLVAGNTFCDTLGEGICCDSDSSSDSMCRSND